jgi:hypothetical protein
VVFEAGKSYLWNIAKCLEFHDEAACRAALADTVKINDFMHQVRLGVWEGVKNFGSGLKMMAECGSPLYVAVQGTSKCMQNLEQIAASYKMLKEHPLELIHLSEWHNNPGKALGLTLFDIGSMLIPVPGAGQLAAGVAKVVNTLGTMLAKGMARLSKGIGTIGRFNSRLADGVGKPGGLAKLADVTVEIDGPNVRIVDGVAVVEGVAYRLEGAGLKLVGSADDFVDGVIHIHGGVVRVDGKIAKLENATVKVEKRDSSPGTCKIIGVTLAAAAHSCDDHTDGTWTYEENGRPVLDSDSGKPLVLPKEFNHAANRSIAIAKNNERVLSPIIADVIKTVPNASKAGWTFRLKSANSLKRKLANDRQDTRFKYHTPEQLVSRIKDNIRYTMTFEAEHYIAGVLAGMQKMRDRGFKLHEFKNSWNNPKVFYQGINVTWYHPGTKQFFELQFHTPESFWLNKAEHPFYEMIRVGKTGDGDIDYRKIAEAMWGSVAEPKGPIDVKKLAYSPEVNDSGDPL